MPNNQESVLIAIFRDPRNLIKAVKAFRSDYPKMEVLSPFPLEELNELLPQKSSKVRWYTFFGALSGAGIGMVYQIMTVLEWPLITGGKPVISIPSFVPITFELMILFGAIATLVGLMLSAELPAISFEPYHSGCSISDFALIIWHSPPEYSSLESKLYDTGASEVGPYVQTSTISEND
jgi:hypothetical protein